VERAQTVCQTAEGIPNSIENRELKIKILKRWF
jgi:hypothetical protein